MSNFLSFSMIKLRNYGLDLSFYPYNDHILTFIADVISFQII